MQVSCSNLPFCLLLIHLFSRRLLMMKSFCSILKLICHKCLRLFVLMTSGQQHVSWCLDSADLKLSSHFSDSTLRLTRLILTNPGKTQNLKHLNPSQQNHTTFIQNFTVKSDPSIIPMTKGGFCPFSRVTWKLSATTTVKPGWSSSWRKSVDFGAGIPIHVLLNLFVICHLGVSKNRGGPPKSSILIGFSIINPPFWGTPIFGNTHLFLAKNM